MYCVRKVTEDLYWVGGNDRRLALFENIHPISRGVSTLIAETFRVSHVVIASVTYNLGVFTLIHNYLMDMKALYLKNRTFAIIENGSWACKSGTIIKNCLDEMKNMTILNEQVSLVSAMNENSVPDMDALVDSVIESMK